MTFKSVIHLMLAVSLGVLGQCWANSNQRVLLTPTQLSYEIEAIHQHAPSLNPTALKLGLIAYHKARAMGLDSKQILTIIDYSKPSYVNRMYVVDMNNYQVPFQTLVAHGQNSGYNLPTNFSNRPGSLQSTLGVLLTENTYIGHNGLALRLRGLEKGINDRASARNIVMHGAWYVNEGFAQHYGRLGRSFGCPAIDARIAKPVINTIKGGTIVFAYYPEYSWLNHSRFLT